MLLARFTGFALVLAVQLVRADELPPLPEPLTLEAALNIAAVSHPDLDMAQARRDAAAAALDMTESDTSFQLNLTGAALYVEPSDVSLDQSHNDSRVGLELSRKLYDFGVTTAREAESSAGLEARETQLVAARNQRRLQVLRAYLDVLLADHAFRMQDEAMAIAYVQFDKLRDRYELGQQSDIDLLEKETEYQAVRSARFAAQARQRTARVALGNALGYTGARPRTLAEPDLSLLDNEPPPLEDILAAVRSGNPELRAAQVELQAAGEAVVASQGGRRPTLTGRVGAYDYARDFSSRDRWRAGIELEWPLFTGGRVNAETRLALARKNEARARLDSLDIQLRERVVELWERWQVLQSEREAALTRMDYRELYLDRSRAQYEMEVTTDLGDAMVESTRARLRQAEVEYQLLLTMAELELLQGHQPLAGSETP
jgi:outer membrane protein TolC